MQIGLVVCTGLGFLLTSLKQPHYGVIANLIGQVFWVYSSYRAWRSRPNRHFHKHGRNHGGGSRRISPSCRSCCRARDYPRSQAGYPHAETEKKVTNFAEAKWTFGIAETYDDYLIDKDEQYLKGKLAEP
jgi:hypothetical protein